VEFDLAQPVVYRDVRMTGRFSESPAVLAMVNQRIAHSFRAFGVNKLAALYNNAYASEGLADLKQEFSDLNGQIAQTQQDYINRVGQEKRPLYLNRVPKPTFRQNSRITENSRD
jgi:hypothetical protein